MPRRMGVEVGRGNVPATSQEGQQTGYEEGSLLLGLTGAGGAGRAPQGVSTSVVLALRAAVCQQPTIKTPGSLHNPGERKTSII